MKIHPTAIVSKSAKISRDVIIGPYSVIGPYVELCEGVEVHSHTVIDGNTTIGKNCKIYPFASIGTPSQDLKYRGETTYVRIGENTVIREYVTINSATGEGESTIVGNNCLLMAYVHIAHNCILGNNVIMANCGTLAGHVEVQDDAIIGGLSAVHQFCKIGKMSLIGGCSKVVQDVPPFMIADGHPAKVKGINTVGLKRKGYSIEKRRIIKEVYRILYRERLSVPSAITRIKESLTLEYPEVRIILDFIDKSERGIC